MTTENAAPAERVVLAFQERYWSDEAEGRSLSLAHYMALWPGHQEIVAREYLALRSTDDGTDQDEGHRDRVGPYLIEKEIGRGGQGQVYRAMDTRLGRRVALKILTNLGPGAEKQLARFKREAEVTARLDHPGICGIHDAGVENGVPFIAMRYVSGETLGARISRTRGLSLDLGEDGSLEAVDFEDEADDAEQDRDDLISADMEKAQLDAILLIFEKTARTLQAAHEAGVVHRDIKPGNIMITDEGEPILLDFGLASDDHDDAHSLTMTGDLFGTPAYMSPEQIAGQRIHLDARSDVYSLGVTLYEALTLRRPWQASTREGLYQAIMTKEAPDPRQHNRTITRDMKVVLECALEKDRDRRYSSAAAFADDLAAVRQGRPVSAIRIGALGRTIRWAKRKPARAALAATIVVGFPLVTALGGIVLANLGDIRARKAALVREEVEEDLQNGFEAIEARDPESALARFRNALDQDPSEPAAYSGAAFALFRLGRPDEAAKLLIEARSKIDDPARLVSLEIEAMRATHREDEASQREKDARPPRDALDWFLAGLEVGYQKGFASSIPTPRSRDLARKAVDFYYRAAHSSPNARLVYHSVLLHAASYARDEATSLATADVIQTLWPQSAVAWSSIGSALEPFDPDRALDAHRRAAELEPDGVLYLSEYANALADSGDIDGAKNIFTRAEPLDDGREITAVCLAKCEIAVDDMSAARTRLELALQKRPESVRLRFLLASAMASADDFEPAAAIFRELEEENPESSIIVMSLARTLQEAGRYEEAREAARRAAAIDDSSAGPHLVITSCNIKEGRLDEAAISLKEATSRDLIAVEDIKIAARHLSVLGESQRGLDLLTRNDKAIEKSALCWHERGVILNRLDRIEEALAAFQRCEAIDPTTESLYSNMMAMYYKLGRYEDSLAAYEKGLAIDPRDVNCITNAVNVFFALDRPEDALKAADTLIEMHPEKAFGYGSRALALSKLKRPTEAIVAARKAIAMSPDDGDAHRVLGVSLVETGQRDEALEEFRVAFRLDPDDRDNATNLMSLLTGRGLWQEAAPVVDRAIAAHPDDAWLLIERARTSYILRKASLALADLRRAIELEPTSNRANYFYALVLGEVESTEAGIEQMRRAMEIAREHPDIPLEIETNPSWTNSMAARIRVRLEEIFYEEGLEAAMAAGEDFLVECSGHEQIAAKLDQLREMKALDPEVILEEQVALARAHERICRERHCDQRRLRAMLAIARLNPEDAHIRNSIAWMKADPEGNPEFRDLDGALLHSLRAVELSERQDPNILDTLAVIRFGLGQLDEAVALQEEIVRLMAGRDAGGYTFATAKAHLTRYRAALATKELNHEQ
ncbi:MAG: tetratricopeptide repeat protein [Planctomycetes bacterium]|nr:tetratricopeptide repeat protein [Planctomycetota bacterium]